MSSSDVNTIINTLKKHWPHRIGLVAAWIVILGLEIPLFTVIKPKLDFITLILIIAATLLLASGAWWCSRKPPKTRKGKVGFALSLWCDDEDEAKRVREDFILTLRRLIKSGRTGRLFQFLGIPSHIAETVVDQDDAQRLKVETGCHFLIYGRIRLREFNQRPHYFLELDGLVAHRPIPVNASKELAKEFSELLPRKVTIAKENDLLAFQFTSDWAEVVARYIMGIAAAVSGDLEYAEQLYTDALSKVNQVPTDFPVFSKLKERIPIRLFELDEARAQLSLGLWENDHDLKHIQELRETLEKIEREHSVETPALLTLKAISAFLSQRDTREPLQFLNRIRTQDRDAVWHFNAGFLKAYDGDLRSGIRHYRSALAFQLYPGLTAKIEDFICVVLEEERNKSQLHYCLGFFNWKIKGDCVQAVQDFQKFLQLSDESVFVQEKKLAQKWITEIERGLGRSSIELHDD